MSCDLVAEFQKRSDGLCEKQLSFGVEPTVFLGSWALPTRSYNELYTYCTIFFFSYPHAVVGSSTPSSEGPRWPSSPLL